SVKTDNGYVALDLAKTYNLATNIFTAKGGDAYTSFGKAYTEGRVNFMYSEQYPFKPDYEVFIQYLEKLGTLNASNTGTEGRIVDVKGIVVPEPGDSGDSGESEPGTGTTTPPTSNTPDPGVQVEPTTVSGGVELKPSAKDLKTETAADGTSVTSLTLAADSFSKALEAAGAGKTIITLPEVDGAVKVTLPVSSISGHSQAIVQVRAGDKSYDLPLALVKPNELAAALGAAVSDIRIEVVIGEVTGSAKTAVEAAVTKNGSVLLAEPVSYTVTAQAGGKTVEINQFGTTYVSRTLAISGAIDPASATAVVFDPASGSMSFVPAVFGTAEGKTVVTIKRNSNSIYGVVKPSAAAFADLNGHWSRPDVELLAAKLVIDGQAPGRFAPDAQVTRGEFAALLVRALGLAPDASAASGVKDLNGTEWYTGALGAAVKAGLLDGFEDGTLRGEANITRAQMAVMMNRALKAAGKPAPSGNGAAFADQGQIPEWAADAVSAGAAAGLVEGTSGNRFAPAAQATRGEAAAMLKRLLKYAEFIN
ncbi:MAG: 5-nucleotidase, partial [Paenibacillaceae bacterium]|nr:5-nucleotidase [Paenibacillaceae bacterium]